MYMKLPPQLAQWRAAQAAARERRRRDRLRDRSQGGDSGDDQQQSTTAKCWLQNALGVTVFAGGQAAGPHPAGRPPLEPPRPPSPPGWCRCAGTPGTTPSPASAHSHFSETSTPVSPKARGSLQQPVLQVLVHVSLLSLVQPYAEIASIVAIETFLLVQYLNCVLY